MKSSKVERDLGITNGLVGRWKKALSKIEIEYNRNRIHSTLNYQTPANFE